MQVVKYLLKLSVPHLEVAIRYIDRYQKVDD